MWLYNVLSVSIILLSATASILAAWSKDYQILTSVVAAISALCATILVQFRVREAWQLREQGRIDAEELIAEAHSIPDGASREHTLKQAVALRLKAHAIERRQMTLHFAERSRGQENDRANPQSRN
ncbi:hypothetical protein B9J07_25745 [Sinorhizobium sp. LM21]|nr:hypothetical protein B9J07_25745 [Sinorhizobium sp. LM21]